MKSFVKILPALVLVLGLTMLLSANVYAQEEMSMDEYRAQLLEWQQREANAKTDIAALDTEIESLKADLQQADADIVACWNEIYGMVGTDEAGVNAYRTELQDIQREVRGLASLAPEELYKRKADISALVDKVNEKKQSKIYALTEMQNMVAAIEGEIAQLEDKMPKAVYDDYVVIKGDYLWKIAGKDEIYDDPYQWMRIYSINKEMIKDPDLIYPDWVLKIQRGVGPDQYLVMKGDFLQKIAENPDVLDDPAAWTKIFEANKDIIGEDPHLIYPSTVLVIPKD